MKKLKAFIAEVKSEHSVLYQMLKEISVFEIIDSTENVYLLPSEIHKTQPEVLFLDMEIPGLDIKKVLESIQMVNDKLLIIALNPSLEQLNELNHFAVFYYLLKPLQKTQISSLVYKLTTYEHPVPVGSGKIKLPIKNGYLYLKKKEILMLEAEGNYTRITTQLNEEFISSYNMGRLFKRLDTNGFFRINRGCVINADYLRKLDVKQNVCLIQLDHMEKEIPVSQSFIAHFNKVHR